MTESEKALIVRLWENGQTMEKIIRMLPCSNGKARAYILELQQNGTIKGRSGKTREKTLERVLQAYNGGISNPYEISQELNLAFSTVSIALHELGIRRKRPPHNYKKRKKFAICDLTERVKKVLCELAEGKGVRETARNNGISAQRVSTIKKEYLERYIKENNYVGNFGSSFNSVGN